METNYKQKPGNKVLWSLRIIGWKTGKVNKLVLPSIQALVDVAKKSGKHFESVIFLEDTLLFTFNDDGPLFCNDLVQVTHSITLALDTLKKKYAGFFPLRDNWELDTNIFLMNQEDYLESLKAERAHRIKRLFKKEFPKTPLPKREKDMLFYLGKKGWDKNLLAYMGMTYPRMVIEQVTNPDHLKLGSPSTFKRNKNIVLIPEGRQGFDAILRLHFAEIEIKEDAYKWLPGVKVERYGRSGK